MNSNWFPHTDFRALLSQMNRRQLIRGAGTLAGTAALSSAMPKISRADDTLNLLCWPGHADPAVVKPFEITSRLSRKSMSAARRCWR